jgi:hypothetical protein
VAEVRHDSPESVIMGSSGTEASNNYFSGLYKGQNNDIGPGEGRSTWALLSLGEQGDLDIWNAHGQSGRAHGSEAQRMKCFSREGVRESGLGEQ